MNPNPPRATFAHARLRHARFEASIRATAMGKKHKEVPVGGAVPLKHNPFGALAGASAPEGQPAQPQATSVEPLTRGKISRGRLILRRETKHRGGKPVIVVSGFEKLSELDAGARAELARELKQALGVGGSLVSKAGVDEIVLQGEQPARVAELLRARGFRVDGVTS